MHTRHWHLNGASTRVLIGLFLLLVALVGGRPATASAQTPAWVDTGGDCLRMRAEPGLQGADLTCLPHGTAITLLAGSEQRDGFTWRQVEYQARVGWVAAPYITTQPQDVQPLTERPHGAPPGLLEPPVGGMTMGLVSGADPAAIIAALPYPVVSMWHLDIASQQLLRFVPGAPPFVNTLMTLDPGDVVSVTRAGAIAAVGPPPEASLTVAGTPDVLMVPPVGGVTQGLSGTTDPKFLAQAQPFTVESVSYFDVGSQQWLVYVPGAPDAANTLRQGQLRVDSVVSVMRGPDAAPVPGSATATRFETTITYYYCVPGSNQAGIGDVGGYCGAMANGDPVHAGAAACAPQNLGQRFTIEGDPTGRTYTCADTGGSVLQDHRDVWFMNSDDGYAWWGRVGPTAIIDIVN